MYSVFTCNRCHGEETFARNIHCFTPLHSMNVWETSTQRVNEVSQGSNHTEHTYWMWLLYYLLNSQEVSQEVLSLYHIKRGEKYSCIQFLFHLFVHTKIKRILLHPIARHRSHYITTARSYHHGVTSAAGEWPCASSGSRSGRSPCRTGGTGGA